MPKRSVPEDEKKLVWDRIKRAAQERHSHPQDHGIVSLVAKDAGVTPQSAQGWKEGRTRPQMKYIAKLAAEYGVSTGYLSGLEDDPAQTAPADEAMIRAKMVELVEDVVAQLNPNADPRLVIEMCDLCLGMLKSGDAEETILGALYMKMRAADTKADAKARGRDKA